MVPHFIFMLTRADRTVVNAAELAREAADCGITRIGFKDVGVSRTELENLATTLRDLGAELYMEVVSLDRESEIRSARIAVELGVDWLLGGTRPRDVLPELTGSKVRYCPFPGRIAGHPSRLEGTPDEIVASARDLASLEGVHGLDLLAWRAAGDAPSLIASVCAAAGKPVIVAGSVDREERIAALAGAGAHGFTIGTALLDGVFPARSNSLRHQIEHVQQCLDRVRSGNPSNRLSS